MPKECVSLSSSESPLSIFEAREHIGETLGECHFTFRFSVSPVLAGEGVRTVDRAVRLQKQSTSMYFAAVSTEMRFRLVGVDACHPVPHFASRWGDAFRDEPGF